MQRTRSVTQKQIAFPVQQNHLNELLGQIDERDNSCLSEAEPVDEEFDQLQNDTTQVVTTSKHKSEEVKDNEFPETQTNQE